MAENEKGPYSHAVVNESIKREQHGTGPFENVHDAERAQGTDPNRQFHFLSLIGLAYAILNSWTAMATSLSIALPSGGPVAVIWGIVPSFLGNLAMAASLAEICHVYPTSGGQYHWSAILAPAEHSAWISWVCGWFATSGWIALVGTAGSLAGSLITGVIALQNDSYVQKPWNVFLIYTGYTLIAMAVNIWALPILPRLNQAAIFWSLIGAVVILITCLSRSAGNFASPKFVFTEFINETGWPNGIAWILGLLQSCFGLTGYDAVSHMVEEMPEPHKYAPRVMILAVCIGAGSSFIFLICLLFCIKDIADVNTSAAGPLLAAIYQGTNSKVAATCLQMFPIVCMFFTAQGLMTASSRMTYAFARDGGMPFSKLFSRMNSNGVPVPAVLLNTVLVIIFGCVYLGSSAALNAILSSSVVSLNISYCVPIAIVVIRGRGILRPPSLPEPTFTLGPILGPICNIFGLIFTAVTTVFFLFPPAIPATGSSMNYAVAVFFIVGIISAITWFTQGRKDFIGPRDLGALLELARTEVAPNARQGKHATTIVEESD
ncbi:Choline transport protein [Vanrija pseudolonga]|uniref:Choline transport protein n=1 Tax=Vanrija pseudolonga TaxID=143232 RepID=A0AAF1BNA7_9TREE|nr:Choline transport protein [Vanrija pseudolonga]